MNKQTDPALHFIFPTKATGLVAFKNKIIKLIKEKKTTTYAGYKTLKEFSDDTFWRYEKADIHTYFPITLKNKKGISDIIKKTVRICAEEFSSLLLPQIQIYIFPWLAPFDDQDNLMGRVSGYAPQKNTLHLFIDLKKFNQKSLKATLAHELNHIIFFTFHPKLHPNNLKSKTTIGDVLVWEGLAENFTEHVTGMIPATSLTLNTSESVDAIKKARSRLSYSIHGKKSNEYEHLFFGGKEFKKWTGYSLGYQLIKKYRNLNPQKNWVELMQTNPQEIISSTFFE